MKEIIHSHFARHLMSCHFSKLHCQACPLCNRPFSKITGGGAVCALQFGAGFMDSWIPRTADPRVMEGKASSGKASVWFFVGSSLVLNLRCDSCGVGFPRNSTTFLVGALQFPPVASLLGCVKIIAPFVR